MRNSNSYLITYGSHITCPCPCPCCCHSFDFSPSSIYPTSSYSDRANLSFYLRYISLDDPLFLSIGTRSYYLFLVYRTDGFLFCTTFISPSYSPDYIYPASLFSSTIPSLEAFLAGILGFCPLTSG